MGNKFQKVSIVGFGNVGSHLVEAFCNAGIDVTHIVVKNSRALEKKYNFISDIQELPKNQLVIVCVSDDSIHDIVRKIDETCPIAYTSGSVQLSTFNINKEIGVFYPLQTFTKNVDLDVSKIPFFIESNSDDLGKELFKLAEKISSKVKYANSEVRAKLHLAGVWVNNFTNHINFIAKDYLDGQHLDFDDLKPLLKETIRKIEMNSPFDVQTGPARRGDEKTINMHINMLRENRKEIYQIISESIQKTYSKDDEL